MRRAGYTNTIYTPITWSDNTVVGATSLNQQLRDNMLALDNRATPYLPSVVHWTPPVQTQTISNGITVFVGRPSTYINLLGLSQYSPNIFASIDISMDVSFVDASAFSVEAALTMRNWNDISNTGIYPSRSDFKYLPRSLNDKGYWIDGTNRISGSSVGATQYAFWTGFRRHDVNGADPFALTAPRYSCDVSIAIRATNGSVSTSALAWSLRFRANARETVSYLEGDAGQYNEPLYGQTAQ